MLFDYLVMSSTPHLYLVTVVLLLTDNKTIIYTKCAYWFSFDLVIHMHVVLHRVWLIGT